MAGFRTAVSETGGAGSAARPVEARHGCKATAEVCGTAHDGLRTSGASRAGLVSARGLEETAGACGSDAAQVEGSRGAADFPIRDGEDDSGAEGPVSTWRIESAQGS